MSATEQMRAMLDGLMGTARDGSDSKRQHLHFSDPRVCRAFLLDCCPHDIFASTKLELGECSKVHDPALRADYIAANKNEDLMYEVSAMDRLQAFVGDADKKTEYLKRKLAETQEELTAEETNKLNRVHDLTEKLGKKLAQMDKAEADGDLEAKQKFLDEAEKIKKERVIAESEYRQVSRPASSHQQQNLRVCDICSAYLGIHDNDSRLADHFGGKLHLGFITVREKLDDLKKIVAEKKGPRGRSSIQNERGSNRSRTLDRDREFDYEYERPPRDYEREGERERSRDFDRYRDRDYEKERYRERERERAREGRYRDRERERDRSRSSSRYYRESGRDVRQNDRYRDDRSDKPERVDRSERSDSAHAVRNAPRGPFDRIDRNDEREMTYQRRLREWEKREAEKARKYEIRESEDWDRKQLEEQESKKLKEFLEDYKDERDDIRFYRGSALSRRLADRRREIDHDERCRQKEKLELEMLSRSCAVINSSPQPIECATETNQSSTPNQNSGGNTSTETAVTVKQETFVTNPSSTSSNSKPATNPVQSKGSTSEDKRKQVEELIGRIPTDKEQLFARKLDWSLLDENLMEKRIRPWVTKKIAEYMGEKEVDLIDFVCTLLNAHTDGASMLREVAIVLDEEAEKFVVHMWRLLIFELEAKKIGLRK